jgi:hypothetical protein
MGKLAGTGRGFRSRLAISGGWGCLRERQFGVARDVEGIRRSRRDANSKAFSSEVDTGSREENASKQKTRA